MSFAETAARHGLRTGAAWTATPALPRWAAMTDAAVNPYAAPTVGPAPTMPTSQVAMLEALGPITAGRLKTYSRQIRAMGIAAGIVAVLQWLALGFLASKAGASTGTDHDLFVPVAIAIGAYSTVLLLTGVVCWWRPAGTRWLAILGGFLLILNVVQPNLLTIPLAVMGILGVIALFKGGRLYGPGRIHHASLVKHKPRARPLPRRPGPAKPPTD